MQNIALVRGDWLKLPDGQWDFAVNPYAMPQRMVVPADVPLGVLEAEVCIKCGVSMENCTVQLSYHVAKCGTMFEMRSVPPLIIQSTEDLHLLFHLTGGEIDVQLFVTFKKTNNVSVPSSSRVPVPTTQQSEDIVSDSSMDDDDLDLSDWHDTALDEGDSPNGDASQPVTKPIRNLSPEMFSSLAFNSTKSPQLTQVPPVRRKGKEICRNLFGASPATPDVAGTSHGIPIGPTLQQTSVAGNNLGTGTFVTGNPSAAPDISVHNIGTTSPRSYWGRFSEVMSALATQLAASALIDPQSGGQDTDDEAHASIFYRDAAPYSDDGSYDGSVDGGGDENVLNEVRYEGDGLFVGKVYKNKAHCKIKLAVYAINRKFNFKCIRSTRKLLLVTCNVRNCGWRVRAAKMGSSPKFQIRKAILSHTCHIDQRFRINRQATTAIIGELVKSKYNGQCLGPKPRALQQLLFSDYNISISYWKAWHAREVAMEKAKGSSEGSFALLPFYVHFLKHFNPGTICNLEIDGEVASDQRFRSLFLAFGASIQGWYYLRKVIVVDGTHLLGKYQVCLLTASAQDGNHQIFPLAFGVVDGENDSSWQWFFKNLKESIPHGYDIVFVSDRHASIYKAIEKEYPLAKHVSCIVHLTRNVCNRFKNSALIKLVDKAARTFTKVEFAKLFQEIQILSPDCAEYLLSIGIQQWSRAYSEGNRYNIMTSNIAESLNHVLMEAREYPIVTMIESIRATLTSWFSIRRNAYSRQLGDVTPTIMAKLEENFSISVNMRVSAINLWEYEIIARNNQLFHVDLMTRQCTCSEFQLLKYPCPHAIAAATIASVPLTSFVDDMVTVENCKSLYARLIRPIPGIPADYNIMCPDFNYVLKAPKTRRQPGRPRKMRIRSIGEYQKATRKIGTRRCTRCGNPGHNRKTCKAPI